MSAFSLPPLTLAPNFATPSNATSGVTAVTEQIPINIANNGQSDLTATLQNVNSILKSLSLNGVVGTTMMYGSPTSGGYLNAPLPQIGNVATPLTTQTSSTTTLSSWVAPLTVIVGLI